MQCLRFKLVHRTLGLQQLQALLPKAVPRQCAQTRAASSISRLPGAASKDRAVGAPRSVPAVRLTTVRTAATAAEAASAAGPVKIAIIYYSMYGHVSTLAASIKAGAEEVPGVEVSLFQVAETLSPEILGKMHAPAKDTQVPIINPATLDQYDGFVFGFPTRFGIMASQFKSFFDATGQLWAKGMLIGKPAGFFTSTASQNGGQEVTILTAVTQLAAHGMLWCPTGYATGSGMSDVDVAHGGGCYGAGTLAGADGSRKPIAIELAIAKTQGKQLATYAKKLKAAL